MSTWDTGYIHCYTFHGDGDIGAATAVQAKLREYGLCSYFNWDPTPPRWRFFYETNLTETEINHILGTMLQRFHVSVES